MVLTPRCTHHGLGSFPFARRYSENRFFFLFLSLLRCFSSGGSLCIPMYSVYSDGAFLRRVSPFRYPHLSGYLLLSTAFRSLSRLSSAPSAKASALRPFLLDLFFRQPSVTGFFYFFLTFWFFDVFSWIFFIVYICSFQGTLLTFSASHQIIRFFSYTLITGRFSLFLIRQPPALPCRLQHSTIGRLGLNRRVRYGYGCSP